MSQTPTRTMARACTWRLLVSILLLAVLLNKTHQVCNSRGWFTEGLPGDEDEDGTDDKNRAEASGHVANVFPQSVGLWRRRGVLAVFLEAARDLFVRETLVGSRAQTAQGLLGGDGMPFQCRKFCHHEVISVMRSFFCSFSRTSNSPTVVASFAFVRGASSLALVCSIPKDLWEEKNCQSLARLAQSKVALVVIMTYTVRYWIGRATAGSTSRRERTLRMDIEPFECVRRRAGGPRERERRTPWSHRIPPAGRDCDFSRSVSSIVTLGRQKKPGRLTVKKRRRRETGRD